MKDHTYPTEAKTNAIERRMRKIDQFDYIKKYYNVPARKGGRVKFEGKPGFITGTSGPHLTIKLDENPKNSLIVHPTWKMKYLEAII